MTVESPRTGRRAGALSKDRIVEAAIEILDGGGESALTFRALAARLDTGSGAIYWHVSDKEELLGAAADGVIARVMAELGDQADPSEAIRSVASGLFDAIDAHPWVGTQLSRQPWRTGMLQILEGIGGRLAELGVPERAQFDAGSALVHYILGVAAQNAANARLQPPGTDRSAFLASVAARWAQLDPAAYPFVRRTAEAFSEHDDRAQFLIGIDLILSGIAALR